MTDPSQPTRKGEKKKIVFLIIFIVIAIVAALLWWLNYRKYISTDDANLDSYRVSVSTQVAGEIKQLNVMEGDSVKTGMLLVVLDDSIAQAHLLQVMAQKEQQIAQLEADRVNALTAAKEIEVARVSEQWNTENYDRAKLQYEKKVIPLEKFQETKQNWESARLQTGIAQNRLVGIKADIRATEAAIRATESAIQSAKVELGYYRIVAPADGIIGKRWSLPGDMIQPGQTILTLNRGNEIWVSVYLEETKFKQIRPGQSAIFTLDAYDDLTFEGKIYYIGDNTASEFALVPPNNASGNFTKVTQRIPLKISIDKVNGDEIPKNSLKLVSGMSATVKIIKE